MKLWQAIIEAFESLTANKVRSALTILGIVIGVGAVIALVSIGRGAQSTITGSIEGIGTNLLFVFRGGSEDVRNPEPITLGDAEAIADPFQAPSVVGVAPVLSGSARLTAAGESDNTSLSGVTPDYAQVRNLKLTEGSFIDTSQILGRSSVVVLGPDTAEKLFGRSEGLVGESVRIEGQPFRIIGILASRGGSAFSNEDEIALIPLTTAQTRLLRRSTSDRVDLILAQAISPEAVSQASDEVAQILRTRHRTAIGQDDFTILSQQDFIQTAGTITNVLTIFLGGIAAISLLVGGIGIMNIMLVSIRERTSEIGLRKAVGAKRRDILWQFLVEAMALSVLGGLIGLLIGFVGATTIASLSDTLASSLDWSAAVLAIGFSAAVGLFFGIYPASRAASLNPIDALHYE